MAAPREQISALQGAMLVVNTILPTAVFFLPAIAAHQAKEAAWLSPLISMAAGMGISLIVTPLAVRFPGQSLIQFAPRIVGWFLGKLIGLCYLFWLFMLAAVVLREFSEFMMTAVMPQTPISVFTVLFLGLCAYGIRHGVEVLSRANAVLLTIMVVSVLTMCLLSVNRMRIENVLPLLGNGLAPVFKGAYSPASMMGEVVIATISVFPYLKDPKKARPVALGALLFTGVLVSLTTFAVLATVGMYWMISARLPMLIIARHLEVSEFFERLELVFVMVWVCGVFVRMSVIYFAFCQGMAQWFELKDYRPLILPVLTLLAPFSIVMFANISDMDYFLAHTLPPFMLLPFQLGLPLLLLLVAALRGLPAPEVS